MYPLDNLLRHLLPLIFEEGIILHAVSLANDAGEGLVACGPSGAGKSTLAELAGPNALSDELSAVEPRGDAARVVSLPYWRARPGWANLRALLFLRHDDHHRLEPLRPQDALRRLATQILWPVWDEDAMKRSFDHAATLLDSVPAFELSFAPRGDVWEFLAKEIL
jgi:hypothetical protein